MAQERSFEENIGDRQWVDERLAYWIGHRAECQEAIDILTRQRDRLDAQARAKVRAFRDDPNRVRIEVDPEADQAVGGDPRPIREGPDRAPA